MQNTPTLIIEEGTRYIDANTYQGNTTIETVVFPSTLTAIGKHAFDGCSSLREVVFHESLIHIGEYAFQNCTALQTLTLPNTLKSLGASVFKNCTTLKTITLPDSLTEIRHGAFENCAALEEISLPDGITTIEYDLFKNCRSLKTFTIGRSVKSIEQTAFDGCDALTLTLDAAAEITHDLLPRLSVITPYATKNSYLMLLQSAEAPDFDTNRFYLNGNASIPVRKVPLSLEAFQTIQQDYAAYQIKCVKNDTVSYREITPDEFVLKNGILYGVAIAYEAIGWGDPEYHEGNDPDVQTLILTPNFGPVPTLYSQQYRTILATEELVKKA